MRKATLIGTLIATMLVFGLMLVPVVGASKTDAPAFQTATETPTTGAATAEPTTAATAAPTTAATAAATTAPATTATTAPGTLPNTGGDSGMGLILLGAAVLLIMGAAVAMLVANRRGVQP
jgi:LPXTG-motif cell wall-anchored protein